MAGRTAAAILVFIIPSLTMARVLTDEEVARISGIKVSLSNLLMEISQSAKRPDIAEAESDCINSVFRELMQTSEELRSYEYLITIETELNDTGDDAPMRDVLRFAVQKALAVLEAERKRLGEVSDQCPRNSNSAGKTQEAIGFIDGTLGILKSIQPRLY